MATEMRCGATIWMTGLCQSGKSTLAAAISEEWTRRGMVHEVIDGDMVRDLAPMGFDGKSIAAHLTRVALAAGLLNRHGVSAVVPVIAPLERVRRHCCQIVQEIGGVFRLVWVNTPARTPRACGSWPERRCWAARAGSAWPATTRPSTNRMRTIGASS